MKYKCTYFDKFIQIVDENVLKSTSFINGIKVVRKDLVFGGQKSTLRICVKNMTIQGKGAVIFQENQKFYI